MSYPRFAPLLIPLGLLAWGCGPGGGDNATPPPTTTVPVDPPPPPPPPDDGPRPEDYITITRANCPAELPKPGLCGELHAELQENIWAGTRDLLFVANRCQWALKPDPEPVIPMTPGELLDLAELGVALDREGMGFLHRLGEVNRRCPEQERFCGRTNVRRDRISAFRSAVRDHLSDAHVVRSYVRGQPGEGVHWNSLRGWCDFVSGGER